MPEFTLTATSSNEKIDEQPASPALARPLAIDASAALLDNLPQIDSAVLESLNMIFRGDRRISFEWPDDTTCTVILISGAKPHLTGKQSTEEVIYNPQQDIAVKEIYRLPEGHGAMAIEAQLGRHKVSIVLASAAFLELLDGPNAALLPPEIICALLESYLEDVIWRFEQAAGLLISVTAISRGLKKPPDRGCNLSFELLRERNRWATSGYLSLDVQGLECLAGILKNQDHPLGWDRVDHLRIPVDFVLGSACLRLSEINSLAGDDIVLLDGIITKNNQALSIRVDLANRPFWLAKKADNQLVVEARWEHAMEANAKEAVRENENISNLEDIELEMVFVLGRKSMSLAEIRRIGPGHIFDLAAELTNPVSIYINGGCIGSGELVKIDNRLGVRLTHYLQRQELCGS